MNEEIIEAQNEVLTSLASSIDSKWNQIICSYELEEDAGSFNDDTICFYITKSFFKTNTVDIELNEDTKVALQKLRKAMNKINKDK